MYEQQELAGATDVSVILRALDSSGNPVTSLVFDSAGMDLQYRRDGGASTAITEATLSALTDPHADGGFLHIGNGFYRFDLPDAACAAGAKKTLVHGAATGAVFDGAVVHLVGYNPFDAVRLGLTALPSAAAEAAGGLYTRGSGAGQIAQPGNGLVSVNLEQILASTSGVLGLSKFGQGITPFAVISSPTPTSKKFPTDLSLTTNDIYEHVGGRFLTGPCAGQFFMIQYYDGTTKEITPFKELKATPANGNLGFLF